MSITVVSWNIAKSHEPWRELAKMDADVALLQEAAPPPDDLVRLQDATLPPAETVGALDIGPRDSWDSHSWNSDWWRGRDWDALYDRWPMVVRLSDRVEIEWFRQISPVWGAEPDEIEVSGVGTITAARIIPKDNQVEPFIAVSMYGRWLGPHPSVQSSWIYADASVHRIISDLSAFVGHENQWRHRVLAAGDLNMYNSNSTEETRYWATRSRIVFNRMDAIGFAFIGPKQHGEEEHPDSSITWEPSIGRMVPTFHSARQSPETATGQLDYAFASKGFHESMQVRALNGIDEWGPSDHCRVLIEISG